MSGWRTATAPAKLNLALVVGPVRPDGKHDVVTVMERLSLCDTVSVRRSAEIRVSGFAGDTLVTDALRGLARIVEGEPRFEARIEKRIPVAAGLGGGSSDAAAALVLANGLLDIPLEPAALDGIAGSLGADVPFFLRDRTQLATGDGTTLEPIELPREYVALLALSDGAVKSSTAAVYDDFDARRGDEGYDGRRAALLSALAAVREPGDLASLPPNDLASAPLADELAARGAFRADVTGAGPVVYGLFAQRREAEDAADALAGRARTWIATPA